MLDPDLREHLLAEPERVLADLEVMAALAAAQARGLGPNVTDLRSLTIERLRAALAQLEDTHRHVVSAAYENLSGMRQVHRAALAVVEVPDLPALFATLAGPVSEALKVAALRLVLETEAAEVPDFGTPLILPAAPGFGRAYLGLKPRAPLKAATLRPLTEAAETVFGTEAAQLGSEAIFPLDLGPGALPGFLVLGAKRRGQFKPSHGSDLLQHFAAVLERRLRALLGP